MSNHNYSQYSKKQTNEEFKKMIPMAEDPEVIVIDDLVFDDPVDVKMEPITESVPEPVAEIDNAATVTGVVFKCTKLNVRSKPDTSADVLATINVNSEIEVNLERSTSDWLKITTAAGVDGYCMRQFVNVKL